MSASRCSSMHVNVAPSHVPGSVVLVVRGLLVDVDDVLVLAVLEVVLLVDVVVLVVLLLVDDVLVLAVLEVVLLVDVVVLVVLLLVDDVLVLVVLVDVETAVKLTNTWPVELIWADGPLATNPMAEKLAGLVRSCCPPAKPLIGPIR
jgi:hypothetical protein